MASETLDQDIATRLHAADQRFTKGRRRLVAVLGNGDGPMTIQQILDSDERLAQSSVYRNLAILEQVGAVTRIVTRDDFARYELAEDLTEHHHHLICSACGDVRDFSLTPTVEHDLEQALRKVAQRSRFQEEAHRLDLVGVCSDCH
ncbi:MAG: Fur family transcriptional regulator [Acidimicrobiales bacterium]|nr:Fur family transcriptional regulator [Acidimicrobiales bacterium]